MIEEATLCHAAMCSTPISGESQLKLFSTPNINWALLWNYFLQHKAQFITILDQALQLLPAGGTWVDLIRIIDDLLKDIPNIPPTPVPVPIPPPTPTT